QGLRHLSEHLYRDSNAVMDARLDGIIVTGMEPCAHDLRAEPYWSAFTDLFDWIAREGPPAVFSCLASHAAVLHFDGIERRHLEQKCFGMFEHRALNEHPLGHDLPVVSKIA